MTDSLKICLDNIRSRNGSVNAVLDIFDDVDSRKTGRLAGRVIGVKANIAVRGQKWHAGIKAYENQIASKDARVVSRLRKAGAIILCNLNMEEGALGAQTDNPWYGKTHNPLKHGYTPGGSCGGSAAAVAAEFVEIALGTDTMGSVRVPSGYCGLWGFKPSHNSDVLDGVIPLSPSLDTVGAHGMSLDDCVSVCEVITGRNFQNGTARLSDIAVVNWGLSVDCTADVAEAFNRFVSAKGLSKDTDLSPYQYGRSRMAGLIISEIEGFEIHEHHMENQPDGFSDQFSAMLKWAARQDDDKIRQAYEHREQIKAGNYPDLILMPTTPQPAFKFGEAVPANQADFTAFANLADRPAICFPIGKTSDDLPISAQLVGTKDKEADLVETVRALTYGDRA